ncbi:putative ABC transport system permease protein [Promicromonospora umidemergens]|uniref:ABC3 transporter permease C-terminal domain-containing protein n=1 Tax=Promicromonospora umidemergens TaxID=629679 RepID=A0ABP8XSE4_9MICO|nr:FtsX-like permease family protein [Promicromonospora umidemergens]MCP2285256.1 putative ABC transport system permease protein [Promicromonospora umidemergens]
MSGRVPGTDRPTAGVRYRQALGRWRLAFRLARRDLRRHTGRAVLIAVMVALPVAAGSFLVTALESNEPYAPADAEAELGPGLQAKIEGIGGPIEQFRRVDGGQWLWGPVGWNTSYEDGLTSTPYADLEHDLERLLPDGDRLVRALKGDVRLKDGEDAAMSVAVQTDFTAPDVASRFPVLEGRLPRDGEIAVTEQHRDLGFDLGDTVEVTFQDGTTTTATISGVAPRYIDMISPVLLPEPGPLVPPEEVTSAGIDLPLWYVTGDEPVTWSDVQDLNAAGAFVTSRDVLLDPPAPVAAERTWSGYVDWQSISVLVALVLVGLLEAIWLIGPAFAVGARRDTRSLALLAVNGAPAATLRAVMLARGLLTGAVGAVVGLGLGIAAAAVLVQALPDRLPALRLPGASLAVVLLIGVLLAVASAWPPARRAARADVVTVLDGRRPAVSTPRWPTVVGAAAAVGGVVLAVVAGAQKWVIGLAAGIVVADLGLILACGGIVALLGRVAHRLPWTWRFALRDAARYRTRTVPAIAAVLVAMAGASAALTYLDAEEVVLELPQYQPWASTGTVALTPGYGQIPAEDESDRLQGVVDGALPDAGPVLAVPVAVNPADATGGGGADSRRGLIDVSVHPVDAADSGSHLFVDLGRWPGPVVTDGSDRELLHALGIPENHLDEVAEALADGRLPLPSSHVDENGNANVSVREAAGDVSPSKDVVLPAVVVGSPGEQIPNLPILPEALLDELGAESATGAYLVENPAVPSDEQVTLLQARADAELVGFDADRALRVDVESGEHPDQYVSNLVGTFATPWSNDARPVMGLAIALAAVFLALVGTWSAVALSAVDARPDLATLAAVGAGPSARRRVVAAQAATISVIGSVLGLVAGTLIGVGWTLLTAYPLAVPWRQLAALAVAVPLLAAVAAWTVTRSGVTLTRRRS